MSSRIGRWTAQFADPVVEARYECSTFESRRRHLRSIIIAIVIAGSLNLISELNIIRLGGNSINYIVYLRIFAFCVGVFAAVSVHLSKTPKAIDVIVVLYGLFCVALSQFIMATHPNFGEMGPMSMVVTVVMIYLFVPVRFPIVLFLAVYASIGLWISWALLRVQAPSPDNAYRIILWLLAVNAGGFVTANGKARKDRLLFTQAEDMRNEVAEHKRTNEELRQREMQVIEARQRAEQALATELATLDEYRKFISVITHELRNPLAIISGHTQLAQLQSGLPEQDITPSLSAIKRAVDRLQGLFERWLQGGCIPPQALVPTLHPLRIADLFEQLEHQAACPATITLSIERPDAALVGHADLSLLLLAMLNLIDNAGKYSPDGGSIAVTAGRVSEKLYLRVSDRGHGISAADQPHVFKAGYRGSHVGAAGGSGFGLFLVQQIATAHRGEVTLNSVIGEGSVFTLWLPDSP